MILKKEETMEKMISMCGLDCATCPAYLATLHDSDDERRKTAETWSKMYGHEIKPGDINCMGCLSPGDIHLAHCSECEMRKCGLEKKVVNCGRCGDYPCEKLSKLFEFAPEARKNLDEEKKKH